MKRMNIRDVPDDVYGALARAAGEHRQSLNAYVVDRLTDLARVAGMVVYLDSYQPPTATGLTVDDAVAAVREVRDAS